ncbi:hypothetical protein ACWIDJ_05945 [Brevundimonas naejangsanensis]
MNPRRNWLKLRTRMLIRACGGLEEASAACAAECRPYSDKQLSRCQNPRAPDLLPIDIVDCLEAYCGQHLITRAIVDSSVHTGTSGELRDQSCEVTEAAADLQREVRAAVADDEVTPEEAAVLLDALQHIKSLAADIEASLHPLMKRGVA